MDIVIVLDGSNSIYPWEPMTAFIQKLIPTLDIGPQTTQVRAARGGGGPRCPGSTFWVLDFAFLSRSASSSTPSIPSLSSDSINSGIKKTCWTRRPGSRKCTATPRIPSAPFSTPGRCCRVTPSALVWSPFPYSLTNSHVCPLAAVSQWGFHASSGSRPGAAKVMVVVTDGESHDESLRESVIAECNKQGITRFGIAVSEDARSAFRRRADRADGSGGVSRCWVTTSGTTSTRKA